MTSLVVHSYEGQVIQQRASDGYVNLTQMAKAGGKKVNDYLRLKSTDEYLRGLEGVTGYPATALVQVFQGGNEQKEQGTWAFLEVAIDFAQWVSVPFRIWANRTLRQAMTSEIVATPPNQVEMMSFNALGKLCSAVGEMGNAMQLIDYDIKKKQQTKSRHQLLHRQ